jgi:hypothetical protein
MMESWASYRMGDWKGLDLALIVVVLSFLMDKLSVPCPFNGDDAMKSAKATAINRGCRDVFLWIFLCVKKFGEFRQKVCHD